MVIRVNRLVSVISGSDRFNSIQYDNKKTAADIRYQLLFFYLKMEVNVSARTQELPVVQNR